MVWSRRFGVTWKIDAVNASAAQASFVMDKAAALGRPAVRRACGDWTWTKLTPWKRVVNALGIRIQEAGLLVYGFGVRQTMREFVVACHSRLAYRI